MSRRVYVITVAGEMDEVLREQFDDVEVTIEHGVSQLRVISPDPPALHGLLHRVEALGLGLIDVRPLDDTPPD